MLYSAYPILDGVEDRDKETRISLLLTKFELCLQKQTNKKKTQKTAY